MTLPRNRESARTLVRWASGVNVLAGIWLVIAPFALEYDDLTQALWNDIVIGVAVFVLALVRESNPLQYEGISWINFVIGAWLIIAPFVLDYSATRPALSNDIIVGVVIVAMAGWSVSAGQQHEPS